MTTLAAIASIFVLWPHSKVAAIAVIVFAIAQWWSKGIMQNHVTVHIRDGLPPEFAARLIPNGLAFFNLIATLLTWALVVYACVVFFF